MKTRIERLLSEGQNLGIDACIITAGPDMRYFSGYRGEGMLLIAPDKRILITDFRYVEQAQTEAPDFVVCQTDKGNDYDILREHAKAITRIGVQDLDLTLNSFRSMEQALPDTTFYQMDNLTDRIRAVKDDHEIMRMEKACQLADIGFEHMLKYIKVGLTEREIALELEIAMRKAGADAAAFSFIIASGNNASMPHAIPTDRRIQDGDVVTMDFGARVDGYNSDITRTIGVGNVPDELVSIYQIVLQAHRMVLEALKPGLDVREVDFIARDFIYKSGYEGRFGHGLGHGVGLLIHEQPRLSPLGKGTLQPDMIVTDEPGIYIPGLGGVRIEDTVLITDTGCRSLMTCSKEWIVI